MLGALATVANYESTEPGQGGAQLIICFAQVNGDLRAAFGALGSRLKISGDGFHKALAFGLVSPSV
jgi:hypothetical protein